MRCAIGLRVLLFLNLSVQNLDDLISRVRGGFLVIVSSFWSSSSLI